MDFLKKISLPTRIFAIVGITTSILILIFGDSFESKYQNAYLLRQPASLENYAYNDSLEFLKEEGIMSGYVNGSMYPEKTLNRAELMKIAMLAGSYRNQLDSEKDLEKYRKNCFRDVKKSDWFSPFVCFGKEKGIIKGYSDATFKPADEINFAATFKILALAFGDRVDLTDSEIWYQPYVKKFDGKIPSEVRNFGDKATRGIVAEIITNRIKPSIRKTRICGKDIECSQYQSIVRESNYEDVKKRN